MEFQIYDASAHSLSNFFTNNKSTYPSTLCNNNNNYSLALDIMENDEYFNWNAADNKINDHQAATSITMPQQHHHQSSNDHMMVLTNRKRKLLSCTDDSPDDNSASVIVDDSSDNSADSSLTGGQDSVIKAPPAKAIMLKAKHDDGQHIVVGQKLMQHKKELPIANGGSIMPQWQVEDISELNADIDTSINEHATHPTFNMNDAILSISGLTVFKQEAPSPTSTSNSHCQDGGRQLVPIQLVHGGNGQYGRPNNNDNNNNNGMYNNGQQQMQLNGYRNGHSPNGNDSGNSMSTNSANSQNQNPNHVHQVLVHVDSYSNISPTNTVAEDDGTLSTERPFQYFLAAATSIATKVHEDTLTYLNQGQSYEIKFKALSAAALGQCRGKTLQSMIRVCFHERRLQYMEREQMLNWQRARPGDRILEMDVPLSYGVSDIIQSTNQLNSIQFNWDPSKDTGAYIKVNCISTEFTPKKHGGEKGVPFRIQIATYDNSAPTDQQQQQPVLLHAAACQVKVFKLKGADRKHKQDRDKVLKRPANEQEKFQPSYDYTILNEISSDAVVSFATNSCESFSPRNGGPSVVNAAPIVPKLTNHSSPDSKPISSPNLNNNDNTIINAEKLNTEQTVTTDKARQDIDDNSAPVPQQLTVNAEPSQATGWLVVNRFERYLASFSNFSGADLLRMSRDDLIQVCGQADGIRLYNALHSKTIAPALMIYVARSRAAPYHAIYLRNFSTSELQAKLSVVLSLTTDCIGAIYVQGPQGIRVHLEDAVLRHIRDESMFSVAILHANSNNNGNSDVITGKLAILLKPEINGNNGAGNINVKGSSFDDKN